MALTTISLLREHLYQNSSERFAEDSRQSYMSYLIWKVFTLGKIKHFYITCMIDGNLLQTAQRSFYFLAVKSMVKVFKYHALPYTRDIH